MFNQRRKTMSKPADIVELGILILLLMVLCIGLQGWAGDRANKNKLEKILARQTAIMQMLRIQTAETPSE
jgi:hypothetical protein